MVDGDNGTTKSRGGTTAASSDPKREGGTGGPTRSTSSPEEGRGGDRDSTTSAAASAARIKEEGGGAAALGSGRKGGDSGGDTGEGHGHGHVQSSGGDSDSCEEDKTGNASTSGGGGQSQKLGRRGDPRMHRAVAARLANPKLSLLEALQIGGFDTNPADDSGGDGVTLSQRKNQLSRRLRLVRQSNQAQEAQRQLLTRHTDIPGLGGGGGGGSGGGGPHHGGGAAGGIPPGLMHHHPHENLSHVAGAAAALGGAGVPQDQGRRGGGLDLGGGGGQDGGGGNREAGDPSQRNNLFGGAMKVPGMHMNSPELAAAQAAAVEAIKTRAANSQQKRRMSQSGADGHSRRNSAGGLSGVPPGVMGGDPGNMAGMVGGGPGQGSFHMQDPQAFSASQYPPGNFFPQSAGAMPGDPSGGLDPTSAAAAQLVSEETVYMNLLKQQQQLQAQIMQAQYGPGMHPGQGPAGAGAFGSGMQGHGGHPGDAGGMLGGANVGDSTKKDQRGPAGAGQGVNMKDNMQGGGSNPNGPGSQMNANAPGGGLGVGAGGTIDLQSRRGKMLSAALSRYLTESSTLLKRCMIEAGFEPDETSEFSRTYIEMATMAVDADAQRVARLRGAMLPMGGGGGADQMGGHGQPHLNHLSAAAAGMGGGQGPMGFSMEKAFPPGPGGMAGFHGGPSSFGMGSDFGCPPGQGGHMGAGAAAGMAGRQMQGATTGMAIQLPFPRGAR